MFVDIHCSGIEKLETADCCQATGFLDHPELGLSPTTQRHIFSYAEVPMMLAVTHYSHDNIKVIY